MTTLARPSKLTDPEITRQVAPPTQVSLIHNHATRCAARRLLEECLQRLNGKFRRWRDEDLYPSV
ncbi:hypothetical protein OG555_18820 [Kribbella sp. NBC_01484]|uniref:hypothetical protein n=1 Tax=Kribbella sp. NBC_01484 TaxID=2903579 RepID=UPI002E33DFAA|nr:hypothetical protein [Kribbella sp. NBC_01484]